MALPLKYKNELERFTDKFGYNKIWAALVEHLGEYGGDLNIPASSDFTLSDMHLKFARNLSLRGCRFDFDVIYETYIGYTDEFRDEQTQTRPQWFSAHCEAEVDGDLKSLEVTDVALYKQTPRGGNATSNFVLVISKKQMDEEAMKFLRANYPKALLEPTKVPIHDIAYDLGLKLELGYMLSEDFSFFGQISFSDTKTMVFDAEIGKPHDLVVTRGTVLIDPEVIWERSAGCENFTVAHEVVHWEKHRLFADIKRLLHEDGYVAHRCPKPLSIVTDSDEGWDDEIWLEWQADGIAARILMPKETLPAKIDEIVSYFSADVKADKTEYYIMLIEELSNFYGTSWQMTKYRLRELGYNEVNYIQIHEYDFQAYTHKIDEYKAYYELCESMDFRTLVGAGLFVYVDNHFVINFRKCIEYDGGVPHLTDFAWANLEKCTLKFANVRVNIKESGKFSDILYRGIYETFQKYDSEINKMAFEFARALAVEFKATKVDEIKKLSITFSQMVKQILEVKKIDVKAFQDKTLLSKATFYRLQNEDRKPSFRSILAFCAGLDLDIYKTTKLLGKAGFAFDGGEAHTAYMTTITAFSGQPIDVRNEFLANLNIKGVSPLGDDIAVRN